MEGEEEMPRKGWKPGFKGNMGNSDCPVHHFPIEEESKERFVIMGGGSNEKKQYLHCSCSKTGELLIYKYFIFLFAVLVQFLECHVLAL